MDYTKLILVIKKPGIPPGFSYWFAWYNSCHALQPWYDLLFFGTSYKVNRIEVSYFCKISKFMNSILFKAEILTL